MKQPETKFKEKVVRDLKSLPDIWYVKTQQKAIRGTPDLILCLRSEFGALELKSSAKAVTSDLQKYNLARIKKAGGKAWVAFPENWNKVFKQIKEMGKRFGK